MEEIKEFESTEIADLAEVEEDSLPSLMPASLSERASATLVDLAILFYLYWFSLFIYRYVVWGEIFGPIPIHKPHLYFLHGGFFFFVFLYFFISESVFFTTPGKFCCWLSVRASDGGAASIFSIIIRTLLRPIDFFLFPFFSWMIVEKTIRHQRLGDLLAGTMIIRRLGWRGSRMSSSPIVASASLRFLAGLIDSVFFIGFIASIIIFLDPQRPFVNFLLIIFLPMFILTWFLLWEVVGQTTPGKWIFGLRLRLEDGRPINFSAAFWRTLFRPIDATPFGALALLFSTKKQRTGDLAASTLVVHEPRETRGFFLFLSTTVLIGALWWIGESNPRSFLTPFFRIDNIVDSLRVPFNPKIKIKMVKNLSITQFLFLDSNAGLKTDDNYNLGDTALIQFQIEGFAHRDSVAWLQQDLTVRYPDGAIALRQESIIDFHQKIGDPKEPIELTNTVRIPEGGKIGRYAIVITLRDKIAGTQITQQKFFQVK